MPDPKTFEKAPIERPLIFENAVDLEKRIDAYFKECDREEDTRVFQHGKEELEKIPTIEKGKRVVKKRIVCKACRQDLWSRGCTLVSGELKLKKLYTVTGLASRKRTGKRIVDGKEEEYEWTYLERIGGVFGDATGGTEDAPNEMLREHSGLPVGAGSLFKFSLQSKNDRYSHFESALFKDEGDEYRFSFPADHPLAGEFEEQMTRLVREYKGQGEYLSVHHPGEQGARDDAPDSTALTLYAAKESFVGELLVA